MLGQTTGDKSEICAAIVINVVTAIIRYFRRRPRPAVEYGITTAYNRSSNVADRSPASSRKMLEGPESRGKGEKLTSPLGNEVKLMLELPWGRSLSSAFNSAQDPRRDPGKHSERDPREREVEISRRARKREDPRLHHEHLAIAPRPRDPLPREIYTRSWDFSPSLYLDIAIVNFVNYWLLASRTPLFLVADMHQLIVVMRWLERWENARFKKKIDVQLLIAYYCILSQFKN